MLCGFAHPIEIELALKTFPASAARVIFSTSFLFLFDFFCECLPSSILIYVINFKPFGSCERERAEF